MRGVRHLLALGTAAVCGVLLYCLRLRFPNPLTEALGPANASPWETGKLVFWAMLPAAAVLRRLEAADCLTVCSREHNGRLRKYYNITPAGAARIDAFLTEWEEVDRVYTFILEEKNHEQ